MNPPPPILFIRKFIISTKNINGRIKLKNDNIAEVVSNLSIVAGTLAA